MMSLQAKEKRIAKALANLVSKLPFAALDEDINETELCSRFAEPFLGGLFDDPEKAIICVGPTNILWRPRQTNCHKAALVYA